MATYTSNYGWTKPSGSDNVDISVLNNNLDDQDGVIHDAFLNMAPPFSESSTYAVDDIVLYTTGLYKCHTAVVTPGSWTGSTNWQVYKLSEGGSGGGGTSNYNDLTNKPSINGVTLSGNKTTSDLGIDKTAVGLGNVPNVSTNDQTPTFSKASTRNNIASGEKLSVILGKIQKFFNDLKTVAFSGNASDLNYDNTTSGLSATDVQGAVDELKSALVTPSVYYDQLGYGAIDGSNNVLVLLGNNNIFDYDFLWVGTSYYKSGVATYGDALVPVYVMHMLFSGDAGVCFISRDSTNAGVMAINVRYNSTTNCIEFMPTGTPNGVYYYVLGVKIRKIS